MPLRGFAIRGKQEGIYPSPDVYKRQIYNSDRWHSVKKARNDWHLAQVNLEETRRKLHDQIAQAVMDAEGYAKELHQMQKMCIRDRR